MLELALSVVIFVAAVVASGHAVIYKREPRAAALWIVVIWLVPAAGPVLYVLLGVSRVRRQAVAMRGDMVHHRTIPNVMSVNSPAQETSVDILLPQHSNLAYVHWATFDQIWQVLARGCRVWLSSGQFDHSKLMIVDEEWTLFGSANWDARSLRLNFEFNLECYSAEFGCQLAQMVRARLSESRLLSLEEVDSRPPPIKLRDGVARLFAPICDSIEQNIPFGIREMILTSKIRTR